MFNEQEKEVLLNHSLASSIKKPSEVEEAVQFCGMAKNDLTKSISLLEDRLSPVLRNPPDDGSPSEKEQEPITKMAMRIKEIGKDMRMFNKRLMNILERLEL